MFAVDTNVFLYAADVDSPFHPACRRLLETWHGQLLPWFTTWSVLYEFLRVCTHPRVFRKPWDLKSAWAFVDVLLTSPGLAVLVETERHSEVAAEVIRSYPALAGNILHDTHTAILMREHGIRQIYTLDADFHRFDFIEVLDPNRD